MFQDDVIADSSLDPGREWAERVMNANNQKSDLTAILRKLQALIENLHMLQ